MAQLERKIRRREERARQRQLGRQGSTARLEAVRMTIQEPRFAEEFDAALWAATAPWAAKLQSGDDVRDLALRVLRDSFKLDVSDIDVKVVFGGQKLRLRPVLVIQAAEHADQVVKAKAQRRAAL